MAARMRIKLKDGVQGIPESIRKKFNIGFCSQYVMIGDLYTIEQDSIIKVLESPDDYEIQCKGAIINLSLNDGKIRTLIKGV